MARPLAELWPFDKRGTHTLLATTAVVFAFIFVIYLKAIFTSFFIALLISYILNPFVSGGEKIGIPRWLSTFGIFVAFTLILFVMAFVVAPSLVEEFRQLTDGGKLVHELPMKISKDVQATLEEHLPPSMLEVVKGTLKDWRSGLESSSDLLVENIVIWGRALFLKIGAWSTLLLDLILIPFYMFFLLTSLNRVWHKAESTLIPYDYRDQILKILGQIHHSLSAFFRGRLLICLMIGTLAWVGLLFLRVPFAFVLGFGIGFATIVPLLGLVFLFPAMILYSLVGAGIEHQLALVGFYALIQGLEMFVFTPFILGREVELPPMILVMSILICGYLFGGIGVVLAVPIASTSKILFHEFIYPSFIELSRKNSNSPKVIQKKVKD